MTYIKYRRYLQTNEPVNDLAIPLDREVSVIAAIGPLNSNKEANSHSHSGDDHTLDDIRIDFSAKNEHSCTSSLYDRKDENAVKPWPKREIIGENTITVRIGPTGGKRGYTAITGMLLPTGVYLLIDNANIYIYVYIFKRTSILGHRMVFERFVDSRAVC